MLVYKGKTKHLSSKVLITGECRRRAGADGDL